MSAARLSLWATCVGVVALCGCKGPADVAQQGPHCLKGEVHPEVQVLFDGTPLLKSTDISSVRVTPRFVHLFLRPDASSLIAEKTSENIGKELVVQGRAERIGAQFEVTAAITGGRIVLPRPAHDKALPLLCAAVGGTTAPSQSVEGPPKPPQVD